MARADDSGTLGRPITLPTWALVLCLLGGGGGVAGGVAGLVAAPASEALPAQELRLERLEGDVRELRREVRAGSENLVLICDRLGVTCRRVE